MNNKIQIMIYYKKIYLIRENSIHKISLYLIFMHRQILLECKNIY